MGLSLTCSLEVLAARAQTSKWTVVLLVSFVKDSSLSDKLGECIRPLCIQEQHAAGRVEVFFFWYISECARLPSSCVYLVYLCIMLHLRWVTRLPVEENMASSAEIQTASTCETGLHCDHVTSLPLDRPLTKDRLNLSRTTTSVPELFSVNNQAAFCE